MKNRQLIEKRVVSVIILCLVCIKLDQICKLFFMITFDSDWFNRLEWFSWRFFCICLMRERWEWWGWNDWWCGIECEMSLHRLSDDERRDFFSKRRFSEKIHLSIDDDFWLFWDWKNENRCLIDCFSFFSEFSIDWTNFVWVDRSRDDDLWDIKSRRDLERDFVWHESSLEFRSKSVSRRWSMTSESNFSILSTSSSSI
jgi:hypothetical protein